MQVQLIYFKASGKYYSDATLDLIKKEIEGQYYNIGDRIRKLSEQKSLPGIVGDWLGKDNWGFAVVMPVEDEKQNHVGCPVLVKNFDNEKKLINNGRFTPGDQTNHIIKFHTFKQHGKYDIKDEIPLDSECVSEGIALTHKISDMFCGKYPSRSGYIMVSCPETLSGCPHLILPSTN